MFFKVYTDTLQKKYRFKVFPLSYVEKVVINIH